MAETLLKMWNEQLSSPAGRDLLATALCRTMSSVAGAGCARVCPLNESTATLEAIRRALDGMHEGLAMVSDHAEFLAAEAVERLTPTSLQRPPTG